MYLYLIPILFTVTLSYADNHERISCKVERVYDGDTIIVSIANIPPVFGEFISVRLARVDTPELHGACQSERDTAQKAKQFVIEQIPKDKIIELRDVKRDKYFRLLAEVYVNDNNLSDMLLNENLAKLYDGSKKPNWCEK